MDQVMDIENLKKFNLLKEEVLRKLSNSAKV